MSLFMSLISAGQTNIVNGEQFNTATAPTVPGTWLKDAAPTWDLNFNYGSGNCHNVASELYTASAANTTINKYFWIPVSFTSGYTYAVNAWSKRITSIKIVFNETADLTTPLSTEVLNGGLSSWSNRIFTTWSSTYSGSGYIGLCATVTVGTIYIDDITITETPPPCTYPTTNATMNAFTSAGESSITVNWSGGNGDKHLVVAKASTSVLTQPTDAGSYTANSIFGSGSQLGTGNYVVYNGTGTSVTVTNLDPGTTFNFYVYEYKTSGPCYKIPGVTANQATTATTNYYVNDNSATGDMFSTVVGDDSKSGELASKPKLTLANLLSSKTLHNGDSIFIDAGTYTATTEENLNISTAGITFIGAGNDKTIFAHAHHGAGTVYFMYISANNVTLKNMTIKEYDNNGSQAPGHSGQAITVGNSATGVLIENVNLSANGASGGNPTISVLANTSTTIKGGGGFCNVWKTAYTGGVEAYGNGITLNIQDYILGYNFKTGSYDGGGLLISNADNTTIVNVTNTRFFNNECSDGGGISQRGGVLTVTNSIIDANYAGQVSANIYGGGVRITKGTATFTNTKFTNNKTSTSGGTLNGGGLALYSIDGAVNVTLNTCSFSGNVAPNGNDLYVQKGFSNAVSLTGINTTFSSAAANTIYNIDGTISLVNCGTPGVSGTNSPAVNLNGGGAPTSTPICAPPTFTGNCSSTITLPIELITFVGECSNDQVVLMWKTASEKNNNKFFVEKTLDGVNYTTIGSVNGAGNSSNVNNYSFVDVEKFEGLAYYRLTQEDFDGARSSSNLIAVEHSCGEKDDAEIILYPNPSSSDFTLDMKLYKESDVSFEMFNSIGALVKNTSNQMYQLGIQTINIDSNELMKGVYYIKVMVNKKEYFQKFVKL